MAVWPGQLWKNHADERPLRRAVSALLRTLEDESDRYFLWIPVFFGVGIGAYFALPGEPSVLATTALLCIGASLCWASRSFPVAWTLSIACMCAVLGFADAKLRTSMVSQPVFAQKGGVTVLRGWVEKTERRLPRGHRITLRVFARPNAPDKVLPHRVRFTSRFDQDLPTGTAVEVRARLRPVPEPVMPGGFDFSRKAFYAGLGAVGFAITPARPLAGAPVAPFDVRARAHIDRVRHGVEGRIAAVLPAQTGAIAMALITGERGLIPEEILQALRDSGLAHMLAISGMHMAIMAGALYWLVRAVAAATPGLALRAPIKKWAAAMALLGAAFYLGLSGAAIATQRAFLMMAIVFTAILLDRPAFTLRNVALAACVILVLFPESLTDVSFQMSFAAVTALIAVYERIERRSSHRAAALPLRVLSRTGWYMTGIALTTLVASIAVAPFAAFHFHQLAQYGLLANLATMPLFGLVVMPAALAALTAMPLGLEAAPLHVMALGISHIVSIATAISGWGGATIKVAAMPLISLLALVMGGFWLCLWRRPWRLAGIGIAAIGLLTAGDLPKPDMLIGRDGKTLALRTEANELAATGLKRTNYSLEQWLRADGDPRKPASALEGHDFRCDELACVATVKGKSVAYVRHPAALEEECARADIVVAQIPINRRCPKARVTVDRIDLWLDGAHALYLDGQSIRVETVAEMRGNRPWSRMVSRRRKPSSDGNAYARENEVPE